MRSIFLVYILNDHNDNNIQAKVKKQKTNKMPFCKFLLNYSLSGSFYLVHILIMVCTCLPDMYHLTLTSIFMVY